LVLNLSWISDRVRKIQFITTLNYGIRDISFSIAQQHLTDNGAVSFSFLGTPFEY
jgi:hypothetical protein